MFLTYPQEKQSNRVRSDDLGGQGIVSTCQIHCPGSWSSKELSHFPMALQLVQIVFSPAECPPSAVATTSSLACPDSTCNGGLSKEEWLTPVLP
jgi:hypothetical protein